MKISDYKINHDIDNTPNWAILYHNQSLEHHYLAKTQIFHACMHTHQNSYTIWRINIHVNLAGQGIIKWEVFDKFD